jgi:hypothetical protein
MKIRQKLLRTTMIVAAGLVTCFATPRAQATTLYVGSCHTGSYSTITEALAAVTQTGTVIDVCPGYYPEQVFISGSQFNGLTLQGIPYTHDGATTDAAVVLPPAGGLVTMGTLIDPDEPGPALPQIWVNGVSGVTISHIVVDAQNTQTCGSGNLIGIYFQEASGTVANSVTRNQAEPSNNGDQCGWGVAAESDSQTFSLTVSNTSVHNFQKNGIVVRGTGTTGPVLTATGNTVIGVGVVPGYAAQNGIEVAFGATGSVKSNYVADMLYSDNTSNGTGILFYSTSGITPTASTNVVDSANVGIGSYSSNGATITSNHIGGSQMLDGIDLCSSGETAKANIIYYSTTAGINLASTACGSDATGATVTGNTINEACAGVLTGTGSGNTTTPNTDLNVFTEVESGGTCTPPSTPSNSLKAASQTERTGKVRP